MNIYIMEPENLNRVAILNSYTAFNWNRVWGESGYYQLWVPITEENETYLVDENLIWPDDQELVGVIENTHKYVDDNGLPFMEVSGRFATDSYLSRRIIWGNCTITDVPHKVIQTLIKDNSIACTDITRRLGISISTDITVLDSVPVQSSISYCGSYGNLWDEVKSLDTIYGLNTELRYSNIETDTPLSVVISAGYDRSETVVLSTDLGFLTSSEYFRDSTSYCNTALIAGEGEGTNRKIETIIPSDAIQLNRRELYVDARDLQKTETMSSSSYSDSLKQRGKQRLLDYPLYESYECSLQVTGEEGYVFGKDYFLGDTVTIVDTVLNTAVKAVVKEHLLSEDRDGKMNFLVFGVSVPTITSLINRRK